MDFKEIKREIMADAMNKAYTERGIEPLFKADRNARLAIVGQAPGRKAEESQLFWNDLSGDRLREWMGVDRELFYGTERIAQLPMDFYYPGKAETGDAPPRKGFAEKWHPLLLKEMPNIKTMVLVGSYATKYYLGNNSKNSLTETVKNYENYLPEFLPLVHPSPLNLGWLKKNPWFEIEVLPVLRDIVQQALKEKSYFVYILRCQDGSLYTGITTDLNRRFQEHMGGGGKSTKDAKAKGSTKGAKYTASHRPLRYEISWELPNRSEALKLEYRIKALNKAEKEAVIKMNELSIDLSRGLFFE